MPDPMVLRHARLVDPVNGIDEIRDLGIAEGVIVPAGSIPHATVIDLSGLVLAPGFIDLHVHLREPGQTHKEDILSGTRAAAAGGFATVVAMPNTVPPVDTPAVLADLTARIAACAVVRVLQTAALTAGRAGTTLTDAQALKQAGACALTDDGSCVQDAPLMLRALAGARTAGLPVLEHCEDAAFAAGGVMHLGEWSRRLGLPGQSRLSEELVVARDIALAQEAGWGVHFQHLSSAGSVAEVRAAQARGIPVTAEATPHHLCLTDGACLEYGTNAKVNPPLRSETDRQAVIRGLQDDTICVIATDHAPHSPEEKQTGLAGAPFGVIGLESAVPVCLTALYHTGRLSLSQFVAKFTAGPRKVMGIGTDSLEPGAPADVTVLDLAAATVIDCNRFHSRSRNCPFAGWNCRGKPVATMVGGRWVFSEVPGLLGLL